MDAFLLDGRMKFELGRNYKKSKREKTNEVKLKGKCPILFKYFNVEKALTNSFPISIGVTMKTSR